MNGVILIDKPLGKTSHDMVSFIRRLTHIKRVGHTGTLDPMASGVLPVCIGKATKAADMLTASDKGYTAQIVLGMTTDTLDAEGEILSECAVTSTREDIIDAVMSFAGEIYQVPPMYSAIKQGGKKLYELARKGIEVERKKRLINIYSIDILEIDMENFTLKIHIECSKGTYIRTLCEDIGAKLGCGAYMNTLVRTKSGMFDISQCYTVTQLSDITDINDLRKLIIPVDKLFEQYKCISVNDFLCEKIMNGVRVRYKGLNENEKYRIYDEKSNFLCISTYIDGVLVLDKAFWN